MELDELIRLRNNGLPCIQVSTPAAKEAERRRLQKEIADFLAKGGTITKVSSTRVRTDPLGSFNNQPANKQKTLAEQRRRLELTFGAQASCNRK